MTLPLEHAAERGSWRKRRSSTHTAGDRYIRIAGSTIEFAHPDALTAPLTIAAGLVAVAAVDRGAPGATDREGRFPILRRMSPSAVVPQSAGVEGWLWTASSGSTLPMLGEESPNLALVFVAPLDGELVENAFRADFLATLAQHSALGAPTVTGLLARVSDPAAAEAVFGELGASGVVTDREVAPAQRRHLSSDRSSERELSIGPSLDRRVQSSVPPPGSGRRSDDR